MKKILPFLLAALSGIIPIISLISPLSGLFVLVGYIPLLYAEYLLTRTGTHHSKLQVFLAAFICFFIANIVSLLPFEKLLSFWIILFSFFSSVCSALVFLLFSVVRQKLGNGWGYAAWVIFTVAAEYWSLNTVFSFPFLLTGILVFGSANTALVQWYEYTGVLGGSVWILLCNVCLFFLLRRCMERSSSRQIIRLSVLSVACVLLPIAFSFFLYHSYQEDENPLEVLIVQPNIDPYTEKFNKSYDEQLDVMLALARQGITPQTRYVVFPETALDSNIWLNNIRENYMVLKIRDSLLHDYPKAKVITGVDMMEYYVVPDGKAPTPSAKIVNEKIYYDFFNAAIQVDSAGAVDAYKKSKLVLGTEYIPFVQKFPAMEKLILNLGGTTQSRGRQLEPSLLRSDDADVATVICFESVFGEYVSKFIKIGGELICIISNDGWWDEKPIPWRHVRFAQLRAIENRRSVIRCANTGISCFIDQRGDITDYEGWWVQAGLNGQVNKNSELTFYSRHGDYVGRICAGLSILIVAFYFYRLLAGRRKEEAQKQGSKAKTKLNKD